jgi:hypothetical protein
VPILRFGGTLLRVGGAARRMIFSLRSDEGGVAAVENLCMVRARSVYSAATTSMSIMGSEKDPSLNVEQVGLNVVPCYLLSPDPENDILPARPKALI